MIRNLQERYETEESDKKSPEGVYAQLREQLEQIDVHDFQEGEDGRLYDSNGNVVENESLVKRYEEQVSPSDEANGAEEAGYDSQEDEGYGDEESEGQDQVESDLESESSEGESSDLDEEAEGESDDLNEEAQENLEDGEQSEESEEDAYEDDSYED